jgi:hypothetical protein
MKESAVKLSSSGMANITKSRMENDFTFIVGGRRHSCPWFVAEFLSPKVSRVHSVDITVSEIDIEVQDVNNEFESILSLGFGSSLSVARENRLFLLSIARELNNWELYFSVHELSEENFIISEFCQQFDDWKQIECLSERAAAFLASHFFELDSSFLRELPISALSQILSNPSLQLESEDLLYKLIQNQLELKPEWSELLCHIRFDLLSTKSIEHFISWSLDHFCEFQEFFCLDLWTALCRYLSQAVAAKLAHERYHCRGQLFSPACDGSLEGIIAHLTQKHGGNVDERGVVSISGSTANDGHPPRHAVDLKTTTIFHSTNAPNQWLCYDFKNRRVQPTHYSISAYGGWYLRSWIFEGSLDGSNWNELDRRENDSTMNNEHQIGTFTVSVRDEYQYLRLRQTGKNAYGHDYLVLYAFEVFGRLIE